MVLEKKAKRRKEETIQRDAEQMIAISANRQMKRRDIDADAEEVRKIRQLERPSVTKVRKQRAFLRCVRVFDFLLKGRAAAVDDAQL